jgi:dephospho-CoA kinase
MGDLVRDLAARRGIRPTRANLHDLSVQALEQHGADFFARQLIDRIQKEGWQAVGISGIRSPADAGAFRDRFGDDFVLVHVRVGDARTRFERVQARDEARDPEAYTAFLAQDREENEIFQIEETIERADLTIDNDGSLANLYRRIEVQVVEPLLEAKTRRLR